jgi:hypothetical protein
MTKKLQNLMLDIKFPVDEIQDAVAGAIEVDPVIKTAMQTEFTRIMMFH